MQDLRHLDRLRHKNKVISSLQPCGIHRVFAALRQIRESCTIIEQMLPPSSPECHTESSTPQCTVGPRCAAYGSITCCGLVGHSASTARNEQGPECCSQISSFEKSWPSTSSCRSSTSLQENLDAYVGMTSARYMTTTSSANATGRSKDHASTSKEGSFSSDEDYQVAASGQSEDLRPKVIGAGTEMRTLPGMVISAPAALQPNETERQPQLAPTSLWPMLEHAFSVSDHELRLSDGLTAYGQPSHDCGSDCVTPKQHVEADLPTFEQIGPVVFPLLRSHVDELPDDARGATQPQNKDITGHFREKHSSSRPRTAKRPLEQPVRESCTSSNTELQDPSSWPVELPSDTDIQEITPCLQFQLQSHISDEHATTPSIFSEQIDEITMWSGNGFSPFPYDERTRSLQQQSPCNSRRDPRLPRGTLPSSLEITVQDHDGVVATPPSSDVLDALVGNGSSPSRTKATVGRGKSSGASKEVEQVKKRKRRSSHEVVRNYRCLYPSCKKAYGKLHHLNAHLSKLEHGPKRFKRDFTTGRDGDQRPEGGIGKGALAGLFKRCLVRCDPSQMSELFKAIEAVGSARVGHLKA